MGDPDKLVRTASKWGWGSWGYSSVIQPHLTCTRPWVKHLVTKRRWWGKEKEEEEKEKEKREKEEEREEE